MATSGMDCGANLEHHCGSGRRVIGLSCYFVSRRHRHDTGQKKSCESKLRTAFDHHCIGRDVSQIQTKFQSNPIGYQYCYPIWLSRAEQKRKRKEKKKEKGIVRLSE